MKVRVLFALLLLCASIAAAQAPPSWDQWKFLLGDWVAEEGSGTPGQTSGGGSTFKLDLDGRVLLRTNRAEYSATKDRAAFVHNDLMVVYMEPGGRVRADYWDNEGHAIHYTATSDGKSATFVSDEIAGQPRFRLIYTLVTADRLKTVFEIALPGKPGQFQKYVEGTLKRR